MRIEFRIDASEANALIGGAADALELSDGLGEQIADLIRADLQRQFSAGGEPHWPALADITVKKKRDAGYPRLSRDGTPPRNMIQRGHFGPENILMETGALLTSWTRADDPNHEARFDDGFAVSITSTLPYASAHQEGDPDRRLPRRALKITNSGLALIARAITDHMTGGNT